MIDCSQGGLVVLSEDCRPLRQLLRPAVWMTLEEVALEAIGYIDDRLIAHTSARQVAERLRIDPATAAGALRVLRQRGLIELKREKDSADRFELSTYRLGSVAGITVCGMSNTARPTDLAAGQTPTMAASSPSLPCLGQERSEPGTAQS
jgi:hypothetical protein